MSQDWKRKIMTDKLVEAVFTCGVPFEIVDAALQGHKAIEEKRRCGGCNINGCTILMEVSEYKRHDFFCSDFTPKEDTKKDGTKCLHPFKKRITRWSDAYCTECGETIPKEDT